MSAFSSSTPRAIFFLPGVYRVILFSVLTIGSSALGLSLEHLGVLPTVGIVWSGLLLITGLLFLSRHMRQATFPQE